MDEPTETLLRIGRDISQLLASSHTSSLYTLFFIDQAARESSESPHASWPKVVTRVYNGLRALDIQQHARIYHVDPTYYSWPLYERALCMKAPSPAHLCKLVVLENKHWRTPTETHKSNAQYYAVLVQYVQTIDTKALAVYVRALGGNKMASRHFKFRLADPQVSKELTGYDKNGVSPVAMTHNVPVIMSTSITQLQPPVFWLGAGHVDYKLALPVQTFIDATQCMVAPVSQPVTFD
ncbi:hypothetical protein GGF45_002476 [Coemansia sp. RSA 551]|nr:hypothetical protein GGF45_002476 [Coemansia sp. RSA 551]KAJ2404678.1 hypothetical protein J3F80_004712 [Coemansia sp. RSA 2526]